MKVEGNPFICHSASDALTQQSDLKSINHPRKTSMNTTPTINVTADGPVVGVATARLLLQSALEKEQHSQAAEHPDLLRKRALNDLTGASAHVPHQEPVMPIWDMSPKDAAPAASTMTAEEKAAITVKLSDNEE